MLLLSQVFSSLGLGLLVGFLVGLSATPMVGLVVGAITALLASFLGLRTKDNPEVASETAVQQQRLILTGIRTGTFALACAVGVLSGMHVRTHNLMSPSLLEKKQELVALGFSPDEARLMVAEQKLQAGLSSNGPSTEDSVLFSDQVENCDQADPSRFAEFAPLNDFYNDLDLQPFARIAAVGAVHARDDEAAMQLMIGIFEALCDGV